MVLLGFLQQLLSAGPRTRDDIVAAMEARLCEVSELPGDVAALVQSSPPAPLSLARVLDAMGELSRGVGCFLGSHRRRICIVTSRCRVRR
jgi:hypothetical protein